LFEGHISLYKNYFANPNSVNMLKSVPKVVSKERGFRHEDERTNLGGREKVEIYRKCKK